MGSHNTTAPSSGQLNKTTDRLALYQQQLRHSPVPTTSNPSATTTMARDPITCHVLNTLTGTPAANLPVTLTLLSSPSAQTQTPLSYRAATDADGRVKNWTPASSPTAAPVPDFLAALPAVDSATAWSIRFEVGPWYAKQGVECFWPDVEVKFVVKGRGREGEGGWRHYHVPVLLGPWSYSTYRGS